MMREKEMVREGEAIGMAKFHACRQHKTQIYTRSNADPTFRELIRIKTYFKMDYLIHIQFSLCRFLLCTSVTLTAFSCFFTFNSVIRLSQCIIQRNSVSSNSISLVFEYSFLSNATSNWFFWSSILSLFAHATLIVY